MQLKWDCPIYQPRFAVSSRRLDETLWRGARGYAGPSAEPGIHLWVVTDADPEAARSYRVTVIAVTGLESQPSEQLVASAPGSEPEPELEEGP